MKTRLIRVAGCRSHVRKVGVGELREQIDKLVMDILARGRLNQQEIEGKLQVRDMGINYRKQRFGDQLEQLFQAHQVAAGKNAVSKELDRLDGAINLMDLHEDDLQKLKTWVRNAKWALVAPEGQNLQG